MRLDPAALKTWRKSERERLIAARAALPEATLEAYRHRMDGYLELSFPGIAHGRLAICWPIKGEYDARHFARTMRDRGALTALPVVVAPKQPLIFRDWHPGVRLATGKLDIPYPVDSPEVQPDVVILPMNGWDAKGYRLGYGAGFFDRTLASLAKRPVTIGVSYELARLDTIHPQEWDIPMDYVVTERGVYRRDPDGLAYLGEPQQGEGSALASPVCYAGEVKRD
ncbi:MAG TPA: 5-formyltetrahydrofolate cyclo-ligase [Burkholderiales bacterium]|nr:5-formyltetrahydrofolate cyclo-ligase [Burkholderiales bacterium]